jgi:putative tricarboxylic transport membrane protein
VVTPTEDPSDTAEPDHPPAAGPVTNLVTAGAVVILGGISFAGSLRLGVGSASAPGPGTWPAAVSAVLVVLGLVLAARFRHTDGAERFTRTGLLVLLAVTSMAAFVAAVGTIGFEIPTAVLAIVWLRFLGGERWRTSIAISLGAAVAFYLLFVAALDVSIPHMF